MPGIVLYGEFRIKTCDKLFPELTAKVTKDNLNAQKIILTQ
jgi:hypothetical protein